MKKIIIVRHAKSSWTDFSLSDFNRPLDKRGFKDAPIMASRIKKSMNLPVIMYSSTALRAQTTANFFSVEFNVPVHDVKDLYHGQPEDYLSVIKSVDEHFNCVALFGHNPGITIIANLIKMGSSDNIPTCGVIVAEFNGSLWAQVEWESMRLVELMFPKDINYD